MEYSASRYRKKAILVKTINVLLMLFMAIHILACLWIRINNQITDDAIKDYTNSLYLGVSTASTVGYGDYTLNREDDPIVEYRYLFSILLIICALVLFAILQSTIFQFFKAINAFRAAIDRDLEEYDEWITSINCNSHSILPWRFEQESKHCIEYTYLYDLSHTLRKHNFIDRILDNTREELEDYIVDSICTAFRFFDHLSRKSARNLIMSYKPRK